MKPVPSQNAPVPERQLAQAGLTLQAVFKLADLDDSLIPGLTRHRRSQPHNQCLLFAHAGRTLWENLQQQRQNYENSPAPVDEYSCDRVYGYLRARALENKAVFLYPFNDSKDCGEPDLQALGRLAGWHNDSPLMLGMHPDFGTWFAYRVLVLTVSDLPLTVPQPASSPCLACTGKPCITACPARALQGGTLDFTTCADYRLKESSVCAATCMSRCACPAGSKYRYDDAQMSWHYGQSLLTLRRWAGEN